LDLRFAACTVRSMVRIGALRSPGIFNGMMWVNRLVASSESGMYSDQSSRQVSYRRPELAYR